MKSIIILSTLLFVTASFMGIGSYIRYNHTLQEKGLYAPQKGGTESTAAPENNEITSAQQNMPDMQERNEQADIPAQQQPVKKKSVKAQSQQQTNNASIVHAAKKPREREINFKEFSRAPLEDYPVPEITEVESKPEEISAANNEENK